MYTCTCIICVGVCFATPITGNVEVVGFRWLFVGSSMVVVMVPVGVPPLSLSVVLMSTVMATLKYYYT
jgi:hypothetical protein